MKRVLAFLVGSLCLVACGKKELDPITGYNSEIQINSIDLSNVSLGTTGVMGYLKREYLIATDTTPVTEKYIDSFEVVSNGHNQQFHFNTSSKAIKCDMQVTIKVLGGTASSVTASSFFYYKDKATAFAATPLGFSGSGSSFSSAIHTVTF